MKKIFSVLMMMTVLGVVPIASANEPGYFDQLGKTFSRGVKNVITAPWEIPYSIGQYDQKNEGNPRVFRDTAGFFDGIFRTLTRFGSGAWDMAWAFVPGNQEGIQLDPEVFF